jgi:lysophospholipase L1-like esterase
MEYIRFAALGDSASCGVGDPTPDGWRGWAQLLADALATEHAVSFCKVAAPGATVADLRHRQLTAALHHRPVVASMVVGLNDAMRSSWEPEQLRADLMHCAGELAGQGTLLVTARFHDHTRILGLPEPLARPLRRRIGQLNEIYDEVHEHYGLLRLDLAAHPAIYHRDLWAFDRLHPSELGHRWLAREVGRLLRAEGLSFELPSLTCTGTRPSSRDLVRTFSLDMAPWLGRRIRDLAPDAARQAARRTRHRLCATRTP